MPRWARSLSAVALGLAAIAAGGERAQAAAPWSEPQSIGGELGRIVFASDGQGMLVGLAQNLPASPRRGRVLVATVNGGAPAPPRVSTTSLDLSTARVYGRDGVVAAGFLRPGVSPHLALARGRIGRPLGRPQSLRGRSRASQLLDLAVNPAGDAVAAVRWCQTTGCGRQTLALFRWRAGARLSRPLRIARGRRLGAGVALNARGDVAILWDRFSARGRRDVFGQIGHGVREAAAGASARRGAGGTALPHRDDQRPARRRGVGGAGD